MGPYLGLSEQVLEPIRAKFKPRLEPLAPIWGFDWFALLSVLLPALLKMLEDCQKKGTDPETVNAHLRERSLITRAVVNRAVRKWGDAFDMPLRSRSQVGAAVLDTLQVLAGGKAELLQPVYARVSQLIQEAN